MSDAADQTPLPDLMAAIMRDPVKKKLVLQLLAQEKDGFEAYRREEMKERTPLKKLKRLHCESPTSLQRRRALEKRDTDTMSEGSSSDVSDINAIVTGPKLPFDQLLTGVRAFVEVRKDNVDRSDGIKAVMKLMGATIKDKFTHDVTHVVFKDGSFSTYEKAKLMNIHLVSVLWLDAVRRNNARVPEKNYPAFGSKACDANVSILCSQLQRDYEDVIKEEKRRTVSSLPNSSTKTIDKSRRCTVISAQTSNSSSYLTAQNLVFSEEENEIQSTNQPESPILTSDDSECGIVNGHITKRRRHRLAVIESSELLTDDTRNSAKDISSVESSESTSLLSRVTTRKRGTINVVSDMILTPVRGESVALVNTSNKESPVKTKSVLQDSNSQSRTMSSLRVSSESDLTKSGLGSSKQSSNITKSSVSEKENSKATVQTSMSSLRLSESNSEKNPYVKLMSKSVNDLLINPTKANVRAPFVTIRSSSRRKSSANASVQSTTSSHGKSPGNATKSQPKRFQSKDRSEMDKDSEPNPSGVKTNTKGVRSSRNLRRTTKIVEDSLSEKSDVGGDEASKKTTNCVSDRTRLNLESEISSTMERPKRATSVSSASPNKMRCFNSTKLRNTESTRGKSKTGDSENSEDCESPAKKLRTEKSSNVKRVKKLYNPNEITALCSLRDDQEREERQKQKVKSKSPEGVCVNPNNMCVTPAEGKRTAPPTESDISSEESLFQLLTEKKKRKSENKYKTPVRRDSREDEQLELLELLNKATASDIRRSERIACSQIKPGYVYSSDSTSTSSLPITPIKRRSTLDFTYLSQTQKRKLKLDPQRPSSIVCTKMHRHEVINFESTVNSLGRFFVEDKVTDKTTHLVAGDCKRTINMLRAIARGCWVLKHEWLLKSQKEGRWLNEEDYELTEFSPAVQQCRLQKEAFGSHFSMDIFRDCGLIYVAKNTKPKPNELRELISICKGKLTMSDRQADIIVGEGSATESGQYVTEMWILDSIAANKLEKIKNYLLVSNALKSPHF